MSQTMQWKQLFSNKKGRATEAAIRPEQLRTTYIRDYDRIVFSSAFRRLQNKTQVFPLPGPAFVHNRLTHSLEVASVGRSLGTAVGQIIAHEFGKNESTSFQEFYKYELSSVIAAACLAHDIGNPPFGHSGEDAIRSYFESMSAAQQRIFTENLTPNQWSDFTKFEGNSNAFRILTHPFAEAASAYNITKTTLASIVKYPSTSIEGFDKASGLISKKKSGYFDSELATWEAIAMELGIPKIGTHPDSKVYARHPFVFLTEAADDICYRVIDLEDAHRLGIVSLEKFESLFLPFFDDALAYYNHERVQSKMKEIQDPNQKAQYLRAVWIGRMIELCTQCFIDLAPKLLAGNVQQSLIDLLPSQYVALLKEIDTFSYEVIYQHRNVVEIEIAGFQVIGDLLKMFVDALLQPETARAQKVLQLVPAQFPINKKEKSLYHNLQSVTDFISGMTDLYAIDLYRRITGISIKVL
jgi:dGTPase